MRALLISLFFASLGCNAQPTVGTFPYEKKDFIVGPYVTFASLEHFDPKFALGVEIEYMVGGAFGFGGILGGGPDYGEVSTSIWGVLSFQEFQKDPDKIGWVIFLPLAFTNPVIHLYQQDNKELALSIDLLQLRYVFERGGYYDKDDLFASGSVSLRYSFYRSAKAQWSFHASGVALYTQGAPKGFQAGLTYRWVTKG